MTKISPFFFFGAILAGTSLSPLVFGSKNKNQGVPNSLITQKIKSENKEYAQSNSGICWRQIIASNSKKKPIQVLLIQEAGEAAIQNAQTKALEQPQDRPKDFEGSQSQEISLGCHEILAVSNAEDGSSGNGNLQAMGDLQEERDHRHSFIYQLRNRVDCTKPNSEPNS